MKKLHNCVLITAISIILLFLSFGQALALDMNIQEKGPSIGDSDTANAENTITWAINDNGTLEISGSGPMDDYANYLSCPWYSQSDSITSVIIGKDITRIGNYSFSYCKNIESVQIPNGVTSIGYNAFEGCTSLKAIALPSDITSIEDHTFTGCVSLTSITIPDSVKVIGGYAFAGCQNLPSITLPKELTSIAPNTFYNCGSLTELTIPNKVTSIQSFAFELCIGLKSIIIPDSVRNIGSYAFEGCRSLQTITIPGNITKIYSNTFSGCSSLTEVTIPDSVTSIGDNAFYRCSSLERIKLPEGITVIGAGLFAECSSLISIDIPSKVSKIELEAFRDCNSLASISIPDTVTAMGPRIFTGCSSLESIAIPKGMKYISEQLLCGCSGLKTVIIPDSVSTIEESSFKGCNSLSSITIPESVTNIKETADDNDSPFELKYLNTIYVVEDSYADSFINDRLKYWKDGENTSVQYVEKMDEHYVYSRIVPATLKKNGSYNYVCSACDKIVETIVIYRPKTFCLDRSEYNYNGTQKTPSVSITDADGEEIDPYYYSVKYSSGRKQIGKYQVSVTMNGLYSGTKELSFAIKGNLASAETKATVSSISDQTYKGSLIKPEPTVKAIGPSGKVVTLKKGTDYKLEYFNNRLVGNATLNIKGIGNYGGILHYTFNINPKPTTISKLTSSSKGFKVTWAERTAQVTGYQIRYSTNASMSNSKTVTISSSEKVSKKINNLKANKKYYVQVRTYKTVKSKKYYSKWSSKKYVTTKA